MDYKECGFCGRAVKTPVVHTGKDLVFCCTSCFRAYKALHPSSETTRKEAGKPNKKKAAANKSSRKKTNKQQHVRKRQKRGR